MAELALYRKWRSKNFEELLGQPRLTQTLKNAVASGKIAHAYLFCGPRGTGKTSAAKILAKALNCEKGPTPTPCNQCRICAGLNNGSILDCIEIDAASNRGIDEIRDLREKVKFPPTQCRTKVYIIDEVHMLTPEAFNALLKTLEEPPPHTVFILCTTEPYRLPPTVTSRCQRFDFQKITVPVIESRLAEICKNENLKIEPAVLSLIAPASDGSLRDALSLLDQLRSFCEDGITVKEAATLLGQTPKDILTKFTDLTLSHDLKETLIYLQTLLQQGIDLGQLTRDLIGHFRKALLVKVAPEVPEISPEEKNWFESAANRFSTDELYRILRILTELRQELRYSPHPQLSAEMTLMRLAKAQLDPSVEALKRRLDALENGTPAAPPARPAPSISTPKAATAPPPAKPAPVTKPPIPMPKPAPPIVKPSENSQTPPPTFTEFQSAWPALMEKLRESRSAIYPVLQEAAPVQLEERTVTFKLNYPFHKNKLEQKKEEFQKILTDYFKTPLTVKTLLETVDHESLVMETAKLFEGAVVIDEDVRI